MKNKPKHIAIFDLDYTLFRVNSSFVFGLHLTWHRILPFWTPVALVAYRLQFFLGRLTLKQLHNRVHNIFMQGLSMPLLQSHVDRWLDQKFSKLLNHPVSDCLTQAKEAGHWIVILSSSPQFLVEAVAKRVGADSCEGTRYDTDEHHRITTICSLIDGKAKATYVSHLAEEYSLLPDAMTAYTDSFHDLPLIKIVGHPIAVNPDRRLRHYCQNHQVPILR